MTDFSALHFTLAMPFKLNLLFLLHENKVGDLIPANEFEMIVVAAIEGRRNKHFLNTILFCLTIILDNQNLVGRLVSGLQQLTLAGPGNKIRQRG